MLTNPWAIQVSAKLVGLKAQSEALAESIKHNGSRGAAREIFIKEFLTPFLPPHIGIGTGEVINHLGMSSAQVDVILYNRGRVPPILIGESDLGIFPWESVIATIEVKSVLTAKEVRGSILNAYSVGRIVECLADTGVTSDGKTPAELAMWHFKVPTFVFAFQSDLAKDEAGNPTGKHESMRLHEQEETLSTEGNSLAGKLKVAEESKNDQEIQKIAKDLNRYRSVAVDRSGGTNREKDTHFDLSYLFGVCVLGSEWCYRFMDFKSLEERDPEPKMRTISRLDTTYTRVEADGKMRESVAFLKHLLMLSNEMPRCFAGYSLDRYL
jgi:hypothetical protein